MSDEKRLDTSNDLAQALHGYVKGPPLGGNPIILVAMFEWAAENQSRVEQTCMQMGEGHRGVTFPNLGGCVC
jgi:hypothetical protein